MTVLDWYPPLVGMQVADPAGQFLGECVSFWKKFYVEEQGIPYADLYVPDGRAKNIWLKFDDPSTKIDQYFDKVGSPEVGDTVVYDGNYGDVALYIGNGQVVGQYGTPVFKPVAVRPLNQPGNPLGFLRLKGVSPGGNIMPEDKVYEELNARDKRMDADEANVSRLYETVDQTNKNLTNLATGFNGFTGQMTEALNEIRKDIADLKGNSTPIPIKPPEPIPTPAPMPMPAPTPQPASAPNGLVAFFKVIFWNWWH